MKIHRVPFIQKNNYKLVVSNHLKNMLDKLEHLPNTSDENEKCLKPLFCHSLASAHSQYSGYVH